MSQKINDESVSDLTSRNMFAHQVPKCLNSICYCKNAKKDTSLNYKHVKLDKRISAKFHTQ